MDTQVIEIIGRHWLVGELFRAGLEVAMPIRDRGVDLIVYAGEELDPERFIARPIQMKAASQESFGVDQKYKRLPGLLHVFVWNLAEAANTACFAFYYPEMLGIAEEMKWTTTNSWSAGKNQLGGYHTSNPNSQLRELLNPFKMTPERWREKILAPRKPD